MKDGSTRHVSKIDITGKGDGKPGNKRGGKNRDIPYKMVDGKRVFGKHYPAHEFRQLTQPQRDAIIKMRRDLKSGNNGRSGSSNSIIASLLTEIQNDLSSLEGRIIAGVAAASREVADNEDDVSECSGSTQVTSGRKRGAASSRSVGGFIAGRRKKRS